MTNEDFVLDRRSVVIAGAGAAATMAALTACTTYGQDNAHAADPPKAAGSTGQNVAAGQPNAIASTSEVPVGGGVIKGDVVVTQPSAGSYVGLSSTCTHAGCKVASVSGGTINCACHGSKFGLDGSVVTGPATQPLAHQAVHIEGDSIVAG
ncbi:Rieske (2Fe-2S) protein [Nocardia sp. NPDC052112]|uniref:Rieske (2Fe-2S) protein n=1 Tax=Nocardia sp. NPDC052112 TaxID=3155646 RepID=UPI0034173094